MHRSALSIVVLALLVSAWAGSAQAPQPTAGHSAILVELFTSEGCSDCPPADTLLRAINGTHLPEGPLIIALSEHVTYWNGLGWTDAFSAPVFTDRQNRYGRQFVLDSVYTPQMVVNGTQQFVGSNRQLLLDALHKEAKRPHIDLKILSIDRLADSFSIRFSAASVPAGKALDIMAAIADDADETRVLHGENGGRTLAHTAVARFIQRVVTIRGEGTQTVRLPWPSSLASEAPRHLVLFAQQSGPGAVLGADTMPLPSTKSVASTNPAAETTTASHGGPPLLSDH